jgi:small subunit ribosomal protein S2
MVGTKDESAEIVKATAEKINVPYVTNRWIGGMLTNLSEMKKRVARMEELAQEKASGESERKYTKKERVVLGRESDKLEFNFRGVASLEKQPDIILVVDPRHDRIAVSEAKDRKIPIMAIMSTDCDASEIKYPVIANDSLQQSVSLLLEELSNAYAEGKLAYSPAKPVKESLARRHRRDA